MGYVLHVQACADAHRKARPSGLGGPAVNTITFGTWKRVPCEWTAGPIPLLGPGDHTYRPGEGQPVFYCSGTLSLSLSMCKQRGREKLT